MYTYSNKNKIKQLTSKHDSTITQLCILSTIRKTTMYMYIQALYLYMYCNSNNRNKSKDRDYKVM